MIDRWAERVVLAALARIQTGRLVVETARRTQAFGVHTEPMGLLRVHNPRLFRRALTGGEMALGESYTDGDWSTPDLVSLVRVMLANRSAFDRVPGLFSVLARTVDRLRHRARDNTRRGSRRNVHEHYDLGNQFFSLFLDANLLYSCALYDEPDASLEAAQVNKLRTICRKLDLGPQDHVLEIGSGWGGFALYASTRYGCRVTTTTISREQYEYAAERCRQAGEAGARIDVRLEDYRELRGRFDKLVSIEMFEAVGHRHYDTFFGACDRLLDRDGVMLLQTITVDDHRFDDYLRAPNWIAKYIFPGGELASVGAILQSLARVTRLGLFHAEQIGTHYARTLHAWRDRFLDRLDDVRAQGFDDRFIRMWDLYLGYCEAAFLDRHIGDVQLLLAKVGTRRRLYGEPWSMLAERRTNEERRAEVRTENQTSNRELGPMNSTST
jgi:cyclopropane-fatty-acyl-phospholipid synthase